MVYLRKNDMTYALTVARASPLMQVMGVGDIADFSMSSISRSGQFVCWSMQLQVWKAVTLQGLWDCTSSEVRESMPHDYFKIDFRYYTTPTMDYSSGALIINKRHSSEILYF